jgi:hypothetical protein
MGEAIEDLACSSNARLEEHLLRHIRVLESQVEGNKEVVASALREIEESLIVRIDDGTDETTALVALTRIDELREILHRLEGKIDALALSFNRGQAA